MTKDEAGLKAEYDLTYQEIVRRLSRQAAANKVEEHKDDGRD